MEPAREPPWAEHEKVYLLAEILKAHPIPSHVLFGVIRDYNVQPRWNDMPLPPGRSLRSSQVAFDTLATANSSSDYRRPLLPIAGAQPIMYSGPDSSRKRPLAHDTSTPMGRLIQPRPPQTYPGDYGQAAGPLYASAMTPTGDPGNKKKRGRPTKAEAQQRAQEAAARGEPYPPPRRARPSITALPEPSPAPTDVRPPEQRTPPTQPTPTQTDTAMTPQNQMQTEPGSESSSGKKRRMKPQPLELEKQRPHGELESPLNFGSGDTSRGTHLTYSSFTPISAPLPSSAESRDRDTRMEGVEESQPRTTTPHSFKDTVGI